MRARAVKRGGEATVRTGARWVGRSRIGRFGFWVSRAPVCGRHGLAFVFSSPCSSCLGLSPLSGVTGAAPAFASVHDRTEPSGPSRSTDRPVAVLPRSHPLMGLASGVYRPRGEPASNTGLVVRRGCGTRSSTVRDNARRDEVVPERAWTSLQRIEATDALPIRLRLQCSVRRGPAPCLRFCTVRAEI